MSQQRPVSNEPDSAIDLEEWMSDDLDSVQVDSTIHKKDSINPDKRRRLEAMREERELMKDIKDVFDDWYDD
ncbi:MULTISPECIES: PA3496 family putative envelope integrity protein [unclassified Neptuniibacter]|jgi:hypothetical protein|uniref:PA3496 family putative envelope integrity protein n=1 Tax=unclassified Neptuniibacter TaxID=2630693 RepID=UPI0026E20829|nr:MULTISPECIES: hypothetical protein [unclassified Neptuniibacter]MDO6513110.1 hypothetical protein [Neptuniibacter sp. 2_MG-2023]MDO6592478.1 hypothetical protein [Neptuniibacter sp. 1_MG-2023]